MSLPKFLWLVYCATVLWISPAEPAKTNEAECKYAISSASQPISVDSRNFSSQGYEKCEYHITAPSQYFIQLNFTKLFGFVAPKSGSNRTCVPELVLDRTMDGRRNSTTIDGAYDTPYVFQSNSDSIQIIYMLNKCPQTSGFTLSFNFLREEKPCAFRCDSSKCIPATSVCDGTSDCVDKSDEAIGKCVNPRSDHIPYIVIVAFVVLITLLGVIVCLVKHNNSCRLMSRIRQRNTTRDGHLRPQSQNSESLVPSPTQEQMEQQVSLLRERYSQTNAMMRDSELGYPPQVQRSKDGEEGYRESQKDILSHRQNAAANLECFRPPPNRTVHDTESPPNYYSDSTSRSFDSFSSKTPPSLQDYNGCPVVIRCYSLSGSASGDSHPDFYSNSYSRTHSSASMGNGGGNVPSGQPPPRYENYNSNSAPTAPSIMNGQGRGTCPSAPAGQNRGSRSSSVRSSPPEYHNAFSVTSANMYRSTSDKANV